MRAFFRHCWRLTLCVSLLSGCAVQTQALLAQPEPDLPAYAELVATPFFAQERYQCGPAALAMVLQAAGIKASPEQLQPEVYLPAREGSLQVEMLTSARRHGTLAVPIAPNLRALLNEVAAGHPVVILQNLGLSWLPRWHYAVVIGFDLNRREVMLRSGLTERQILPMRTFEHTWARSQYWAMVALAPGTLPVSATEAIVTAGLVALEKFTTPQQAQRGYQAGLTRWPDSLTLQLGLGNSAYAAGQPKRAATAFRDATQKHADSVTAFNNLASVLSEMGQHGEALRAADHAVSLGGPLQNIAMETREAIRLAMSAPITAPGKK